MPTSMEVARGLMCPFRREDEMVGVLCYDPWKNEALQPPANIRDSYCEKDFRDCPVYLAFRKGTEPKVNAGLLFQALSVSPN